MRRVRSCQHTKAELTFAASVTYVILCASGIQAVFRGSWWITVLSLCSQPGSWAYQSAVMSLWDNIVNKKYYVTGGVGSGETSEGFGPNYSLRHNAYCESCSSCGEIFFQHKLNMTYHDAKYADLYEETLYNALLGSIDLEGKNFYYQNPLDSRGPRYDWHGCPCCVGNIHSQDPADAAHLDVCQER
jgi:DUF1680 family protein